MHRSSNLHRKGIVMKVQLTFVAAVLVAAAALDLVASGTAHALKTEDVVIAQFNCNVGCDSAQTTCNGGCCILGGRLCSGKCITTCQATADQCKADCASAAIGATSSGAFADTATIARNGRTIAIEGPFVCPQGGTADLEVTLTQDTGAVAKGTTRFECPAGNETSFALDLNTIGNTRFHGLGAAQACGAARITAPGVTVDAFQWCRDVTVVPEGVDLEAD